MYVENVYTGYKAFLVSQWVMHSKIVACGKAVAIVKEGEDFSTATLG